MMKRILIILPFFILGCSKKEKIDISIFISQNNNNKYSISKNIHKNIITDLIYLKNKLKITPYNISYYKNNNKIKIYSKDPWTITLSDKNNMYILPCYLIDTYKETIKNKYRQVIHTQCKYTSMNKTENIIDWFIVEDLGIYKTILTKNNIPFSILQKQ